MTVSEQMRYRLQKMPKSGTAGTHGHEYVVGGATFGTRYKSTTGTSVATNNSAGMAGCQSPVWRRLTASTSARHVYTSNSSVGLRGSCMVSQRSSTTPAQEDTTKHGRNHDPAELKKAI